MPVTNYIWDPLSDSCLMETDEVNATAALYTHQPQQFGNLISQRRGADSHFHHPDALGSTVALTNESEEVTDTYRYKAYGEPVATTGSTENPFRWVGNVGDYWDEELGQYYVRARHYDADLVRWLSRDPIGYEGRDINLYRYVGGNPVARLDPLGLIEQLCIAGCHGRPAPPPPLGGNNPDNRCQCPNSATALGVALNFLRQGWGHGQGKANTIRGWNAMLHCVISCKIHQNDPTCDGAWDRREPSNTTNGMIDFHNNAAGRTVSGDCWSGCLALWRSGDLQCLTGDEWPDIMSGPCDPPPDPMPTSPLG